MIETILEFPLIAPNNTRSNFETKNVTGSTVYFGTGVATSKELSCGLPFDFFNMLFTAEWVRRKANAKKIIHEISDFHAYEFYGKEKVKFIAERQREQILDLVSMLGLGDKYECVLASEYRAKNDFKEIQEALADSFPSDELPYVRYQSEGNFYFADHHNVGYKIGWLINDNDGKARRDERFFNDAYDNLGLRPLSFIYTWSGWNFDKLRARVCPYTSIPNENRMMLRNSLPAFYELQSLKQSCASEQIFHCGIKRLVRMRSAYATLWGGAPKHVDEETDLYSLSAWIDNMRNLEVDERTPVELRRHA